MNEELRNAIIEAIWRALDDCQDEAPVRDTVEQAIATWEP